MTTGLDTRPTNVVEDAAPRKSRSGTETRRRSEHMTLRLLPQEKDVAQVVADEFDMPSIQALIVDACQPLMSPGALAALAVDRESLQALAKQHGISEVQALLLQALTSPADPNSGQVAARPTTPPPEGAAVMRGCPRVAARTPAFPMRRSLQTHQ